jgi:hypothetical protein
VSRRAGDDFETTVILQPAEDGKEITVPLIDETHSAIGEEIEIELRKLA